jgi:hypothetical protein
MSRRSPGLAALAFIGVWGGAVPAGAQDLAATTAPQRQWTLQADLGGTLASRSSTTSTSVDFGRAQALGIAIDRAFDRLHLFARSEANTWREHRDDGSNDWTLIFNLGGGARLDYGGGRLRSSVAAGATIVAVPTDVDKAGTIGVFADVRPLGYAWPLGDGLRAGVVPLSFTLAVPVLTGIPLVSIQYRTTVFVERDF